MAHDVRCPACGARNRLQEAANASVLAIAAEVQLPEVLQRIVDTARDLVGAGFAAAGVPGPDGTFAAFVVSGLEGHRAAAPPRADGLLGAMLTASEPFVTADVHDDPRFSGWPAGYPQLRSFLGFPIEADGEVVGAFYLGNENTWGFGADDLRVIELVAPHAALAIRNARLHERSRELSVLQERNRLARDLHDSVTQALFSMRLAAETTLTLLHDDPGAARAHVERLSGLARGALAEMRALIHELRPPRVEEHGLAASLREHAAVLRHVYDVEIAVQTPAAATLDGRRESELFLLTQEALANALKHARASTVSVTLEDTESGVRVVVADDGRGFDTTANSRNGGLGLTSMRERAGGIGGRLTIDSAPAQGTVVTVEVDR